MSSSFLNWWNGGDSPARHMTDSTKNAVEYVARDAFNAGLKLREERRSRVKDTKRFSLEEEPNG